MSPRSEVSDLELLQIEIETLWARDDRGRLKRHDLVVASSSAGSTAAIGTVVPDNVAMQLILAVSGATPATDLSSPPVILEWCRRLLEDTLGPVEVRPGSGPSFVIPESVAFRSEAVLVRSDASNLAALREANPGNWGAEEWQLLVDGQLGPWVMATHDGTVISICHTPASSERGAEAGVWTRPEFRGQGHAAAVTAAWASLLRPTGRYLFYSTSRTNLSSQRVAARLGLRPIGWLWKLGRQTI